MPPEAWSLGVSFIAMAFVVSSYFLKSKSGFLLFQSLGIIFLMASYLFDKLYFAMIGLGIGLVRVLVYFAYEKKDKKAPIAWAFVFSGATVVIYFIVNIGILHSARLEDIVYLIGLAFYAFVFRIRNLELMRYTSTIPTALSILYNVLCKATPLVVVSYLFELCANIVSILKYHVFGKNKEEQTKEKEYEEN